MIIRPFLTAEAGYGTRWVLADSRTSSPILRENSGSKTSLPISRSFHILGIKPSRVLSKRPPASSVAINGLENDLSSWHCETVLVRRTSPVAACRGQCSTN
jgi:hypothetical protein